MLSIVSMFAMGPLVLFVGSANASSHTADQTTRKNSGTPNSSDVTINPKTGVVISYGDSAITYNAPSTSLAKLGQALFLQNCASCHGTAANGVPADGTGGAYPNLVGVGPATIDFWVDSGRRPPRHSGQSPRTTPQQEAGARDRLVGQLTRPQLPRHPDAAPEGRQRLGRCRPVRPQLRGVSHH
jgi:mono/diheme cytochrome c family protein